MPSPRRPLTSIILVLITAISCGAAWLLVEENFIPAVDTGIALLSVAALVWGLRKVYQEEAIGRPIRSRTIRVGRNLIHSLWAIAAILLNVVVCWVWYFSLPDYEQTLRGRKFYAYLQTGAEKSQITMAVHARNGLRQVYVDRIFVDAGCRSRACLGSAIDSAATRRLNKNL